MKNLFTILILFWLTACGSIQVHKIFSKPANVDLSTTIGSELYRIKKQKDLPNAFGKADLFGGKVDAGYTELRFMGLTPEGHIIFRLTDIGIESNETTMGRYGTNTSIVNSNTKGQASVYGNTVYGTSNTSATIKHYEKPKATVTQLPPNTIEFAFNPKDKMLKLEGVTIEVKQFTPYSINYILHR